MALNKNNHFFQFLKKFPPTLASIAIPLATYAATELGKYAVERAKAYAVNRAEREVLNLKNKVRSHIYSQVSRRTKNAPLYLRYK